MAERLANRLKERRAELSLTQAELAERVGVTRKTVNTVENGVFTPSALLAIKMAAALGLRVEELFWLERSRSGRLRTSAMGRKRRVSSAKVTPPSEADGVSD